MQSVRKIGARTRAEEQNQRKEKKYEEYDWLNLVLQGEIDKLTVHELDKYIDKHNLGKKGKKKDKLSAITADVLRKSHARSTGHALEQLRIDQRSSDSDGESEQNHVLEEFGSDSETGDESEGEQDQTDDPVPLVVQTRYGRYPGNWALSDLQ